MPSYAAAGIIGGVVALGFLIWTIWTQTPRQIPNEPNFNPGPGYDRPRDTWTDEDDDPARRRRRGKGDCNICNICKESLTSQPFRRIPCEHIFHDACITTWFRESRTCPTCRRPA